MDTLRKSSKSKKEKLGPVEDDLDCERIDGGRIYLDTGVVLVPRMRFWGDSHRFR